MLIERLKIKSCQWLVLLSIVSLLMGCVNGEVDFDFTADKLTVQAGAPVTLSWRVNPSYGEAESLETLQSVVLEPGIGSVAPTGQVTVHPDADTTYFLVARFLTATGTEVVREASIDVSTNQLVFTADRHAFNPGDPVTLTWQVENQYGAGAGAQTLQSVSIEPGIGQVAAAGQQVVYPQEGTTYQLIARFVDASGQPVDWESSLDLDTDADAMSHEHEDHGDEVFALASQVKLELPKKSPRLGTFTLGCKGNIQSKCDSMSKAAAAYYTRNSRGKLVVKYTGTARGQYVFKVDPNRHNNNVSGLSSYLKTVAIHELGHRLGLGHSKKLVRIKQGPLAGKQAQDNSTVMNGRARGSKYLIAPQYYHKGWLPDSEVALYDGSQHEFELKRISDFKGTGLSTVVVTAASWNRANPGVGSPIFISFPSPGNCQFKANTHCVVLHFLMGGGTRLIRTLDKGEFTDARTGVKVELLPASSPDKIRVRVNLVPQA